MTRLIIGPFNRVEGDLEVRLDIQGGLVGRAEVVSPLYRGFENMLSGKAPSDALVYVPRICGICSVSQSVAAARALVAAQGLSPSANGEIAMNIIHAIENVADHLTHFYLFFMPDFTREAYKGMPWFPFARQRFAATKGTATADVLPARAAFLNMLGILAGKWPHTLGIRPGGSTRAITGNEKARLTGMLLSFRRFLEKMLFGDTLEAIAGLNSVANLDEWRAKPLQSMSDFGLYLEMSASANLSTVGKAHDRFLSFGAYARSSLPLFKAGIHDGTTGTMDASAISEDVSHAWYEHGEAQPPLDGRTLPQLNDSGYTWCKAPRYSGRPMEVGALARQAIDGNPLILDLLEISGGSVHARIVARVLEIALSIIALEKWLGDIDPAAGFIEPERVVKSGFGIGLTEAARGSLGHWLRVEDGKIANYQIIAPTTWNFSPRDDSGNAGPLETALEGLPVDGPDSVLVQHVVRSFDPCMVCTVH